MGGWLSVKGLSKSFPGKGEVLKGINLRLGPGITVVLGPNGSGKSTFLRCLSTVLVPNAGEIRWNGEGIRRVSADFRYCLGYLPQEFSGYPGMTCRAFLVYVAALKLIPPRLIPGRVDMVLAEVGLQARAGDRVREISGGMMRRLGLAQALLNDPDVLLLDEPTTGLDPAERMRVVGRLRELSADRLVLLVTHLPGEAEPVADYVMVLDRGKLLTFRPTGELIDRARGTVWEGQVASLRQIPDGCRLVRSIAREGSLKVRVLNGRCPLPGFAPVNPGLEDAYLAALHDPGPF